jgi:type I restriction enzyme S subunit
MNAELLLAHYDRISDAPDAVARLRKFILDLAVRGKLVEQNPDDESAERLMRRITKNRSTAIGHVSSLSIRFTPSEPAPFSLPSNWTWARLGSICSKTGSGSTPRGGKSVYQQHGVPFLRSQNVYNDGLRLDDVAYIADETHEHMSGTAVEPGDLLLNITGGSIGRCCLVPQEMNQANISQHVAIIRVALDGIQYYLHKLVLSPYFQSFVLSEQTGAGRLGLPKNKMDLIAVALPPLQEQHRIVAKVDELMVLCDQLEASRREQETRRGQLTASAHHHLNNGADAEELRTHAQFFIGHLPRLTKRPDQIKHLRQTILNLAVRGKLVHQSSDDKHASELLKCISVERAKLVKAGVIQAQKEIETFQPRSLAFDLPIKWKAASLGQIAFSFKYGTSVKCSYEVDGEPVLRIPNIDNGRISTDDLKFGPLSKREADDLRLRLGDILMVRSNGSLDLVGRPAIVEPASVGFCYAGYLVRVRTSVDYIDTRYLLLALNSPHTRIQIECPIRSAVGLKNVNTTELSALLIPFPPLAEQHRIVARFDKLMALCNKLEASLSTAQTETSRLLESVLHHALEASA